MSAEPTLSIQHNSIYQTLTEGENFRLTRVGARREGREVKGGTIRNIVGKCTALNGSAAPELAEVQSAPSVASKTSH